MVFSNLSHSGRYYQQSPKFYRILPLHIQLNNSVLSNYLASTHTQYSQADHKHFPFLDLPTEIRNRIYFYTSRVSIHLRYHGSQCGHLIRHPIEHPSVPYLGLACANRQLRAKFLQIWLHESVHYITFENLPKHLDTWYPLSRGSNNTNRGKLIVTIQRPPQNAVDVLHLLQIKARCPDFEVTFEASQNLNDMTTVSRIQSHRSRVIATILNDFMGNKHRQWLELVGIFTKTEFRITDGKSGLYVQSDNSYAPAVWD